MLGVRGRVRGMVWGSGLGFRASVWVRGRVRFRV